ncbi:tRNA uridine(34) 5-carboxymethylaminomethyl modification radical SAM/GNAT enzyme Elp3 [Candidatus Woesearchaeota archaeon]|nr:tRNA uridine(34) 5-carboxymethylaminomethyl modification radical SAM/GNAT enzyme Elp3 [Candidatus Woesearchaeota archaeon]
MAAFYSELISALKHRQLSAKQYDKLKLELVQKHKLNQVPTNIDVLLHCTPPDFPKLIPKLLSKPQRTISGVAPVAIMTKPFPCPHGRCIMCPGGVDSVFGDVPQSYTGREPATMRGIRNNFDPYLQVFNRLEQYVLQGHNCDKVELIIMGGTFPSFPQEYQEEFVKYGFKAMNDFSKMFYDKHRTLNLVKFKRFFELPTDVDDELRVKRIQEKLLEIKKKCTLEQQQHINETAKIRCVALCIETRPDYGTLKEGNEMLRLGCTRVELGIQSVYDEVLKKIERGHTTADTKNSIRILRDLGFKVAAHYMPGLPDNNFKRISYRKDLAGMKQLFSDSDYKPDMLKLYPCMVSRGTKLYSYYKKKKFIPLNAKEAAKLLVEFKKSVPEYCRIMRIQRDIPTAQMTAGVEMTNLRQYMAQNYEVTCKCIRCREPKGREVEWKKVRLSLIKYTASQGKEFFISAEDTEKNLLIGFIRMRFPSQVLRPEITKNSALIRELHVYGTATGIGDEGKVQHRGWGKKLMQKAEEIAKRAGKDKMVVISGVGAREYYRKLGYKLEGVYMVKKLYK